MFKQGKWFFWIAATVALLAFLGHPPVQRTQEARVLETARQMPGHGWEGWIVPHLNGGVRLQKPPLAYWMSAAGFEAAGVNDFAGRALFALFGLGTLAGAFAIARRLFNDRVAMLSVAMLLTSYLFFRYTRLAETDAPAAMFVTLSIAAITAAAADTPKRPAMLYHLAAIGIALAGLAKGPPLLFPLVFLLFISIALRTNYLWRFIRCGAPITLLIVLLPWYAYIVDHHGWKTFLRELNNNREGGDHGGGPWKYLPWLIMALLPWTIFTVIALIGLGQTLWHAATRELKLLLAWILAIALPLAITGNKQAHYLLPLMPPLMVLTAWQINLALVNGQRHVVRAITWATIATALGALCGAIALPVFMQMEHVRIDAADVLMAAVIGAGAILSLSLVGRSLERSLFALIVAVGVFLPIAVGYNASKMLDHDPRVTAREIRTRYGDSPLVFYGPNQSLPLCYNLRQAIESTADPDELLAKQKSERNLVAILQDKAGRTTKPPPAPFVLDGEPIVSDDQVFTFYRVP